MVKQEKYNAKMIYNCEVCGFNYREREYAQKCEEFCKEHKGCSLDITKHSIRK